MPLGLMVTRCRACQRRVSSAKPRSPRQRVARCGVLWVWLSGARTLSADGLLDRGLDALAGALVAGVGQRGQVQRGRGPVQGADDAVSRATVRSCW